MASGYKGRSLNVANPINWQHPLAPGLVAWWLAAPGYVGGSRWMNMVKHNDLSAPNKYHGTLTNIGSSGTSGWNPSNRPGGPGWALTFDGTDDFVDCGGDILSTFTDFTVITNFVWLATGSFPIVWSQESSGSTFVQLTLTSGGQAQFYFTASGVIFAGSTTTIVKNQWYRVACRFRTGSGGGAALAVNGRVEGTDNSSKNVNGVTFCIGKSAKTGNFWPGLVDEIRIYNRALTNDELLLDYQQNFSNYGGLLRTAASFPPSTPATGGGKSLWWAWDTFRRPRQGW